MLCPQGWAKVFYTMITRYYSFAQSCFARRVGEAHNLLKLHASPDCPLRPFLRKGKEAGKAPALSLFFLRRAEVGNA